MTSCVVTNPAVLKYEGIAIDFSRHVVTILGRGRVHLTRIEFELLTILVRRAGSVVNRQNIIANLWDDSAEVDLRTVDQHIRRLREKIGRRLISTVRDYGYRLAIKGDR